MFTNHSDCSNCGHYTVCSCKGRYRDFANDVTKVFNRCEVEDKTIFSVIVDCRQWIPINNYIRRVNETYCDERDT